MCEVYLLKLFSVKLLRLALLRTQRESAILMERSGTYGDRCIDSCSWYCQCNLLYYTGSNADFGS